MSNIQETAGSDIWDMASKAETISSELKVTIKVMRDHLMTSTDFDEIHVFTRALDALQKDVFDLSNELYSLHRSAQPKALNV